MNETILAITILLGRQDELWIPCLVDEVEWTDSRYNHQN
ncbi:hypothetical protein ES703_69287 [subsurface metagenome]